MNVVWHPAAEIEMLQQVSYYESRQRGLSTRFIEEIEHSLALIGQAPQRHPSPRGKERRYSLTKFPFVIYFSVIENQLFIYALSHRRRQPDYWRNRMSSTK